VSRRWKAEIPPGVLEPLYTAAEMRAAEAGYPGYPASAPELMDRAGSAVAREAMRAFPRARRFAVVCGSGANGGDGAVAARVLGEAGREAVETDDLEASTSSWTRVRHRLSRCSAAEAAALIARINDSPAVVHRPPSGERPPGGRGCRPASSPSPSTAARWASSSPRAASTPAGDRRRHRARASATDARRTTDALLRQVPRRPARLEVHSGVVLAVGGSPGLTGAPCYGYRGA
jgi:hypothetical protein